ncbi:NAD(P)/FAD-dependent oxidoreductase [Nonomuraea soli]|uniref:D-amino-acid dehydrogenase n=1 Tax=Nonomuraea soli TaxID=1032476 RepID=A0A7W0CRY1_9ACTN|nr:FAD-dependent oxidoreductase [Nonomuraea soli]MBA2896172.1 D-amino-acid dehydrogenase [Nonomuraea soli]
MRVVVIGSGIVGASAAFHLAGRGVEVTVVDGGHTGQATAAGAGIVCPWVDHEDDAGWYALARAGAAYYGELAGLLGRGYARAGALVVGDDLAIDGSTTGAAELSGGAGRGGSEGLRRVRELLERRRAGAPEMGEIVDVERPGLGGRGVPVLAPGLAALYVPGAARVDGRVVRDALLAEAVRLGATVMPGEATLRPDGEVVVSHHPRPMEVGLGGSGTDSDGDRGGEDDGVGGGRGDGGRVIPCDGVVVAAGAWSGEVCRPLGVRLEVWPRRGQILHLQLQGHDTAQWPMVLPQAGPYMVGFEGGRLVVGATVERVGFDPRVTAAGLAEVLGGALRVAPGLAGATVVEARVGLRPVYGDGRRPLIAAVGDRVVVATGLSAYGLTAGPYAGLMAAAIVVGERPPIDPEPYMI